MVCNVWYDNSSPSMKFPVDGFGFLLEFALLKGLCWVVVMSQPHVFVFSHLGLLD